MDRALQRVLRAFFALLVAVQLASGGFTMSRSDAASVGGHPQAGMEQAGDIAAIEPAMDRCDAAGGECHAGACNPALVAPREMLILGQWADRIPQRQHRRADHIAAPRFPPPLSAST